jgi:hypothetical protein
VKIFDFPLAKNRSRPYSLRMSNTARPAAKFYAVILIHPQHGMRKVESLATSLNEAEEMTSKQWSGTDWKVDFRSNGKDCA